MAVSNLQTENLQDVTTTWNFRGHHDEEKNDDGGGNCGDAAAEDLTVKMMMIVMKVMMMITTTRRMIVDDDVAKKKTRRGSSSMGGWGKELRTHYIYVASLHKLLYVYLRWCHPFGWVAEMFQDCRQNWMASQPEVLSLRHHIVTE